MALGEKHFEESGEITGFRITKVHPSAGVITEVSFTSEILKNGNIRGLNIMTGFTNSQKLSWMNNIILALEISGSVFSQKFKATGYEWK